MIVLITAIIGSVSGGKPYTLIINISPIIPPPGMAPMTAPTKKATARILKILVILVKSLPNNANKKTILRTPPNTEPSLCVLAPRGIIVSAISYGTPIFRTVARLTGMQAALEHVAIVNDFPLYK
jgi:hypothetical protein